MHKNIKHPFNLKASCFCCALPIKNKKKQNMNLVEDAHWTINLKFPMKFGFKEKSVTNTDR